MNTEEYTECRTSLDTPVQAADVDNPSQGCTSRSCGAVWRFRALAFSAPTAARIVRAESGFGVCLSSRRSQASWNPSRRHTQNGRGASCTSIPVKIPGNYEHQDLTRASCIFPFAVVCVTFILDSVLQN